MSARPGVAGATGRGVITGVWVCAVITMAASAFNGAGLESSGERHISPSRWPA